jgi:hypothetical protein
VRTPNAPGTGGDVLGPEIGIRELFCQVFGNRQRIGDGAVFGLSRGTLPVGECLSSRSRVSGWLSLISSSV